MPEFLKAYRPVLWVGQSIVLGVSPVINTQVVLCEFLIFVYVVFVFFSLRKWFFFEMNFCDRPKLWIHANTGYANIRVFCMFQKAELLTAFIMGLL